MRAFGPTHSLIAILSFAAIAACGDPPSGPFDISASARKADKPLAITVTDLPDMMPYAVNARGMIVGAAHGHAALWSHGATTDLGTLGGASSAALGINGRGVVAGWSTTSTGAQHAFLWWHGRMTDLGTLGGENSVARAINELGEVVGTSNTAAGVEHAFLSRAGRMRDLGTLGGENSRAEDINAAGEVVGSSEVTIPRPDSHAFLWRHGVMIDLASDPTVGTQSEADAINAFGLIAGEDFGISPTGAYRLMFWRGTSASYSGYANDHLLVNDLALNGSVVGSVLAGGYVEDGPFLWRDGTIDILPPPDEAQTPETGSAFGIDPTGRFIVGLVLETMPPQWHGVLWTVHDGQTFLADRASP